MHLNGVGMEKEGGKRATSSASYAEALEGRRKVRWKHEEGTTTKR